MNIKNIGKRTTRPRKLIVEALSKFSTPITVNDIHEYLRRKNEVIDLTSIYRNLELMRKSDVVSVILFGEGKKRYELKDTNDHHHHFFCENCGDIEDIEMKEENLLKEIKNNKRFLIRKHNLEFFGLCPKCQ